MSAKSSAVVMPMKGGAAQPADAAAVTEMKGGALVLSPLPLSGGRRKGSRKTKKVPKKVLKLFKKGSAKTLKKLMKGGQEAEEVVSTETAPESETMGGRKTRRTRKGKKGSRKHGFLY
jgi:hypothetical protein